MSDISKRERLEATLAGEPTDRIPVALWRHFPGDDQDSDELARAHLEFQSIYDFDFIKVTPAYSFCVTGWGVEDRYDGNNEGVLDITRRAINRPDDWHKIKPLDPTTGSLGQQLRTLELLHEAVGDEVPFIQTIFNPLAMLMFLVGEMAELPYLRREPELVKQVLEVLTETNVRFVEEVLKRGAAGVFMSTIHASYLLFTESEYLELGRPYDLRVLEAAQGGWFNVLHIHGEEVMFDLLTDYPVAAINWHDRSGSPSLAGAATRFSGTLIGGLRQWDTLLRGTPDQVRAEVRDAVEQTGGRHYILGAGCVTPITTPTRNIWAARKAVES